MIKIKILIGTGKSENIGYILIRDMKIEILIGTGRVKI